MVRRERMALTFNAGQTGVAGGAYQSAINSKGCWQGCVASGDFGPPQPVGVQDTTGSLPNAGTDGGQY